VFENVYTDVPNSGSAFFSAMMGISPLPTLDRALATHRDQAPLSQLLRDRGYRTEMHLNGYSDVSMKELSHTFDRLLDAKENWPGLDRYAKLLWGYDERLLFDEAHAFLDGRTSNSQPFFLVLYTSAPHAPYSSGLIPGLGDHPDPKVRHRRMVQYDMDLLTGLYEELQSNGLAASTAILAYGDHGEAFNEHQNNIIHSKAVFDENVHVPMLLIHPGRFGLPARISQLGSVQDILPTTFDLLGLPLEPRDGMSLFFDAPERLVFALTDYGPGQIGLRDKRFTYILFRNGKELFFDRDADPAELTNVLDRFPEDVARFRARLQPKK
jgi:arylsulfatase A-like enzyme